MQAYSEALRLRIVAAFWSVLQAIASSDAHGYFTHCGYRPLAQHA